MTNTHSKSNMQLGANQTSDGPKPVKKPVEKTAPSMQYQQGFAAGR